MDFKIKKEIKIALTAIAAVILLYFGLNFLKGVNIMKTGDYYYFSFNDVSGLTVTNSVYTKGYPIGIIRTIELDHKKTKRVIVGVEINDDIKIPKNSYAELNQSMLGESSMSIVLTKNNEYAVSGDTMMGQMHNGVMNQLGEMMPTIQNLLPKLDSILINLNKITGDTTIKETLHNASIITNNLAQTTKDINLLFKNQIPTITNNITNITSHIDNLTAQLSAHDFKATLLRTDSLITELNTFTANLDKKFNSKDNTLGLLMNDNGLYNNLNNTFVSADSLLKDLKGHPKRYVHFSIFGRKDK